MLGAAVADDVMGLVVLTVVVRLVTEGSVSVLVGRRDRRRRGALPRRSAASSASGSRRRSSAPSIASRARPARSSRWPSPSPSPSPSWPTWPSWPRSSVPSSPASPSTRRSRRDRDPARADAGRPPLHPGVLPADRHRRRHRGLRARRGAARRRRSSSSSPSSGSCCRRSVRSASPGDKPLIGLGMLPRGEVGLIFATIGLQNGVLGDDLYAALLLVVLVTTLVTPQLLKVRYHRLRADSRPPSVPPATRRRPTVVGSRVGPRRGRTCAARPPDELVVPLALDAADPAGPAPAVGRPPRLARRRRAGDAPLDAARSPRSCST